MLAFIPIFSTLGIISFALLSLLFTRFVDIEHQFFIFQGKLFAGVSVSFNVDVDNLAAYSFRLVLVGFNAAFGQLNRSWLLRLIHI